MPSGVAWTLKWAQMIYLLPDPTEAIRLQSELEVWPKSKTETLPDEKPTRYRPPGTMKNWAANLVEFGTALCRGHWDAVSQMRRRALSTYATFSISKSLMSDMCCQGILDEAQQPPKLPVAVLRWKALQVLIIILDWFELWCRHTLHSAKYKQYGSHPGKCLRASARPTQPSLPLETRRCEGTSETY